LVAEVDNSEDRSDRFDGRIEGWVGESWVSKVAEARELWLKEVFSFGGIAESHDGNLNALVTVVFDGSARRLSEGWGSVSNENGHSRSAFKSVGGVPHVKTFFKGSLRPRSTLTPVHILDFIGPILRITSLNGNSLDWSRSELKETELSEFVIREELSDGLS